jgi:signal transduction histidine kinase
VPASRAQEERDQIELRRTYVRGTAEVLAEVAVASADAADLRTLLDRLTELTMEATGADRVSLFLVNKRRSALRLWAATTNRPYEGSWDRSQEMPAIPLDDVPARRRLFEGMEPVGIEDVRTSELVPADWVDTFDLASLVAAPLRAGDESLGILVADYREQCALPAELVSTVGAIARTAALAVSNAWLSRAAAERAAGLQSLLDAAQSLSSPSPLAEVAEQVADAIVDVLGARHLSVHLLQEPGSQYRTLVQRGVLLPAEGDLRHLSRRALARVARAWERSGGPVPVVLEDIARLVHSSVELPEDVGPVLVMPLARPNGDVFAFILAGLDPTSRPTDATLELAGALAAHVAFAIERARLAEEVAMGAEFACALLALNEVNHGGPEGLLADLRKSVPPAIGFEVVDVRLADDAFPASHQMGGGSEFERGLWRRWRARRTRPEVVEHEGRAYAPVWSGERTIGIVQARPARASLAVHERNQFQALASALGEAVDREQMRRTEHQRERELAMAAEQADVASQLHATVGRLLAMLEDAATDLEDAHPTQARERARRIAALARAGREGLAQTASSLAALAYDPRGLEATLADVVEELGKRLEAAANIEVRGEPRSLSLPVEQALTRILYEALRLVERNGRAGAIAVRLEFGIDRVDLIVRDDGVGLASREDGDGSPGAHFGLRLMQRRLEDLGGRLEIEQPGPRGLLLRATVPA